MNAIAPLPVPSAAAVDAALHERLRQTVSGPAYQAWLSGFAVVALDGAVMRLALSEPMLAAWARNPHVGALEAAARHVVPGLAMVVLAPRRSAARSGDDTAPRPSIDAILRAVCVHYGVNRTAVLSHGRSALFVRPRHVAIYLARQLGGASLYRIGRRFGGRDHSTIHHAVDAIANAQADDPGLAADIAILRAQFEGAA